MNRVVCSCVDQLFNNYDYNNIPIKRYLLKNHCTSENAWIIIKKNVYSIQKDDFELLELFKNYYGKDVTDIITNNYLFKNIKEKIIFLEKINKRKIGFLID
jgi:cytochrome b involved in lipid metabolism